MKKNVMYFQLQTLTRKAQREPIHSSIVLFFSFHSTKYDSNTVIYYYGDKILTSQYLCRYLELPSASSITRTITNHPKETCTTFLTSKENKNNPITIVLRNRRTFQYKNHTGTKQIKKKSKNTSRHESI